jgi:hypothetical protein
VLTELAKKTRLPNRIIAASAKGVTTENAGKAKKGAAYGAVFLNGLDGIDGTRGVKAATGRQQWRDEVFVPLHQTDQHGFREVAAHRKLLFILSSC